jgi:ABC-type multidrug transport system ATPase subunit
VPALVLSARRVARRFGRRVVLEPLDLDLAEGEVVALGGPNGAGKSTLLAILAGALAPSGGEVSTSESTRIGWMPQQPALYRRLTPRENLELFARLAELAAPDVAVERALAAAGLIGEGRRTAELSVGNVQRLNLAVGLLGDPLVLLLDEPTASLDVETEQRVLRNLSAWGRERAILIVTHRLSTVRQADRIAVMGDGRVVEVGDHEELLARPNGAYRRLVASESGGASAA